MIELAIFIAPLRLWSLGMRERSLVSRSTEQAQKIIIFFFAFTLKVN